MATAKKATAKKTTVVKNDAESAATKVPVEVLKPLSYKGENYLPGDAAELSKHAFELYAKIDVVKEAK